jgi:hypothetical protein
MKYERRHGDGLTECDVARAYPVAGDSERPIRIRITRGAVVCEDNALAVLSMTAPEAAELVALLGQDIKRELGL